MSIYFTFNYLINMHVGEWWNANTEAVINQSLVTGAGPNVSDSYTINGLPGPLYNCSAKGKCIPFFFIS